MRIIKAKDYAEMSRKAANIIAAQVVAKPNCVLGLATGGTPVGTYQSLINDWYKVGDLSFAEVTTVNLDEYRGLPRTNDQSYWYFMHENLFNHVDIRPDAVHVPNGENPDAEAACAEYDAIIKAVGGVDLQLLGIGHDGHIGFNEPADHFPVNTHCVDLTEETIEANKRFFASKDDVPRQAYTMGVGTIMNARKVLLIASGADKAEIIKKSFFGPVTPEVPASILQMHPDFTLVCDEAALSLVILGILCGVVQGGIDSDVPVLLASDDLAPSETIQLDKSKILGFITSYGSSSSHTAILARTMGIPAIVGLGDQLDPIYEGRMVVVDGATGAVIIDPTDAVFADFVAKREEQMKQRALLDTLKGEENITKDGQKVRVYCNIGSPEDVDAIKVNDGGGIGLFRSEFLYLNSSTYPTEDEQFEAYKAVLTGMGDKEVIIRTCDIGADKQIDYFELPKEENPAMGMRALRISLSRPAFFRTQLRALYRVSAYGNLGIMFPMVTSVWEVRETKKLIESVKKELDAEGLPYSDHVEIGVMIETPAAAVISDRLAKEVDFFSCGTNDLTQYTLACDRQNNDLGRFYDPHHLSVVRLLKMVVDNAHKNGVWVGICGELGADLEMTETFLAIGVDELSVTPRSVLPLRNKIRSLDISAARERILHEIEGDVSPKF